MKPDPETRQIHTFFDYPREASTVNNDPIELKTVLTMDNIKTFRTFKDQTSKIFRHKWISEAAYFKAEARSFVSGKELDDWLDAEQDYIKMLVDVFLSICQEDGIMTHHGLQQLAKAVGVKKPERVDSKLKLIRLIQTVSRHRPCFRTNPGVFCEHQAGCQWSNECQKLVAEYWR